jgi:hypothetical protein
MRPNVLEFCFNDTAGGGSDLRLRAEYDTMSTLTMLKKRLGRVALKPDRFSIWHIQREGKEIKKRNDDEEPRHSLSQTALGRYKGPV